MPYMCQYTLSVITSCCVYLDMCGNLSPLTQTPPMETTMAKRKRTETISLRVDRGIKMRIEALTATENLSATSLLESLIYTAAQETMVTPGEAADMSAAIDGLISIEQAITAAEHEIPALMKFRLYFLAPAAVSQKDRFIILTVLDNPEVFRGVTPVFDADDYSGIVSASFNGPHLNITRLEAMESTLEKWHDFRVKNPSFNFTFEAFVQMSSDA